MMPIHMQPHGNGFINPMLPLHGQHMHGQQFYRPQMHGQQMQMPGVMPGMYNQVPHYGMPIPKIDDKIPPLHKTTQTPEAVSLSWWISYSKWIIPAAIFVVVILLYFACTKIGSRNMSREYEVDDSQYFMNSDSNWNNERQGSGWPGSNPWSRTNTGPWSSDKINGEFEKKDRPTLSRPDSMIRGRGPNNFRPSLREANGNPAPRRSVGGIRFDVSKLQPLAKDETGYEWVRKNNSTESRHERKKISSTTIACANARTFVTPNGTLKLTKVMKMLSGTRVIRASSGIAPTEGITKFSVNEVNCFATEVGIQEASTGKKVVLFNGASKYRAGGGFICGGRHAMEESLCCQSSLYLSLQRAIGLSEFAYHVPDDGVVLSPYVEVFRTGVYDGYEFRKDVVLLEGVVSIAMWNKNLTVNDAPVDAPSDPEEYRATVEQKFSAAFEAALSLNPELIVVPDIGCGVYANESHEVGLIVGKCARDIRGQVPEVRFCGDVKFMSAALSVATS